MQFLSLYESYFKQSLTNTQLQTFKILVLLITVQKTVKIERLAACFPLPIKYESRQYDESITSEKALLSKRIKSDVYVIRLSICTFKNSQFI
ncbi:hypothetical protein [Okeania sp. KiyG1]|uniref:hypothetical protein n=1 Tax=Okeania sp. KiyG1 TaxID=2720165 RepID=UPI0019221DBB|nr:hypothetical protein [Okeania sp. KiyG1]GGA11526.1 hypothetical protein CYANOKiyG1_24470 [Okeania sp. KiyG1]GGA18529.1 hypothetical protein CYANOKiyG1_33020 [Okeania sp. KiyG1]